MTLAEKYRPLIIVNQSELVLPSVMNALEPRKNAMLKSHRVKTNMPVKQPNRAAKTSR